jgi:serine-type D-Ala-D-Ala carboxypeptidase (penicillin-binding protein 5/6)
VSEPLGYRSRRAILAASAVVIGLLAGAARGEPPATGPLRRLESNPRYFTDGSGRAVLLVGSHNWHNFQDNGHRLPESQDPPPAFDYDAYLDFLGKHGHNFFRLWRWEVPKWTDAQPQGVVKYCTPHPWKRTGPGMAADGKPKFDLESFDPEYFDRLRQRVIKARDRGIYVAVMLFEGWELQFTDAWTYHPFRGPNNVNDIDADPDGRGPRYNQLRDDAMGQRVLSLQEAYVRKVIGTVNDLDNVLYEVCNEAGSSSTKWQYHLVDFIHRDEAGRPKRHPAGMTFMYPGGTNQILIDGPADWISPNPGTPAEGYKTNPSAKGVGKVIVNDTDHLWGHTGGDSVWVWKSFTRGLNVLFMEELTPSPIWQDSARVAMGQVRRFADRIDLAHMEPAPELAQTGYLLAARGREYLAYQDGSQGEFSIELKDAPGTFAVEWFDTTTGKTIPGKAVEGGGRRIFTTPFPGPAAIYLKRAEPSPKGALRSGDTGPAVEDLQRRLNARLDPSPALDVDGDFGAATRAAVARFQRSRDLEPTGVADEKTRQALGNGPVAEPAVPAPEVVNARPPRRQPPDPLDGPPFVTAKAWAVADGKTGEILRGERADEPRAMASTTKIMTALVVLRLAGRDPAAMGEEVTFSERADKTTGSTAGVRAGERLPVRELLYGLLLPSGNDAAVALAEHFGGRLPPPPDAPGEADPLPRFVAEMNRVAAELGLRQTRFANPNGLPARGHHSSARDLATLARHALALPDFARVVSTARHGCTLLDGRGGRRDVAWTNTNRLLETEGYDGVKTGTTTAAGSCLVASGRRGGDHLIVVVLGCDSSGSRDADARNLFRWAWHRRGHAPSQAREP